MPVWVNYYSGGTKQHQLYCVRFTVWVSSLGRLPFPEQYILIGSVDLLSQWSLEPSIVANHSAEEFRSREKVSSMAGFVLGICFCAELGMSNCAGRTRSGRSSPHPVGAWHLTAQGAHPSEKLVQESHGNKGSFLPKACTKPYIPSTSTLKAMYSKETLHAICKSRTVRHLPTSSRGVSGFQAFLRRHPQNPLHP